jgi:CDGSH-type Zn-finger protein
MSVIDTHYRYEPCRFRNGVGDDALINEPGTNQGSCKIFFFAQLLELDQAGTLSLFGDFYRRDVLEHPDGTGHANIRRFMRDGWAGIAYEGIALTPLAANSSLAHAELPRSEFQGQQPTEETTMDKPTVPQKGPYTAELEPGTYWWCACGRSARQPFCDGSHKGTSFSPVAYEVK